MEATTLLLLLFWILMETDTVYHQRWDTTDFKDILYTTKKKINQLNYDMAPIAKYT